MKRFSIFMLVLLSASQLSRAQCNVQIEIMKGRFMVGEATLLDTKTPSKKIEVKFSTNFMKVIVPADGQNYQIMVENHDCKAYCTKAKRVRQLNSGDEKLVKNLFKQKQSDILQQINTCLQSSTR